jgi:uncharacterized protein YjbI with pentapeptide repeats
MRGLKRDLWKAGIAIVGMLLLLVLMAWIPVAAASAEVRASGVAAIVTVQATPTEDATVTALNKEKLAQEVQQLKNQNEPTFFDWLRGNVSILLLGIGALAGFLRWLADRRDAQVKELEDRKAERVKRAEERFQAAVTGLGDDKEGTRINAAILLRTFLRPGYEEFYTQTFDLAVANLRLRNMDPQPPEPPDALSQALITAFKESFPRARDRLKEENSQYNLQSLDASRIRLDNAYLKKADLKQAWMPQVSLRDVDLSGAELNEANLFKANLYGAYLSGAYLSGANLSGAILCANFSGADLSGADLSEADLSRVNLYGANLSGANLYGAYLSGANLYGANLSGANLSRIRIEDAFLLKDTDLRGVKGLTNEQKEACKARGAIIDEDTTTSSPQPTVAPSPSSQSSDVQAPSAPPNP